MKTTTIHCLTLAIVLGALFWGNEVKAGQPAEHCNTGDVTGLAEAGPQGVGQTLNGSTTGLAYAYQNCQARLYDDNGPYAPHVWCERDAFLLGLWVFENYKLFGISRNELSDFLDLLSNRAFWTTPSGTTELDVNRTAFKNAVSPVFGQILIFHDYVIFPKQTLQPGFYSWDFVQSHPIAVGPGNPDGIVFTTTGEIEIVSHEEHLSRLEAGTW